MMKKPANITQKERVVNYIFAQIDRINKMIDENTKSNRSSLASTHLYAERNALYKELRSIRKVKNRHSSIRNSHNHVKK